MLVLSRRVGEEIVIDGCIRVEVLAVKGHCVRLGIIAPERVPVDRAEVHQAKQSWLKAPAPGRPVEFENA